MSEDQKQRMEELWARCCDMSQEMSSDELHELAELLRLEDGEELESVEV